MRVCECVVRGCGNPGNDLFQFTSPVWCGVPGVVTLVKVTFPTQVFLKKAQPTRGEILVHVKFSCSF